MTRGSGLLRPGRQRIGRLPRAVARVASLITASMALAEEDLDAQAASRAAHRGIHRYDPNSIFAENRVSP